VKSGAGIKSAKGRFSVQLREQRATMNETGSMGTQDDEQQMQDAESGVRFVNCRFVQAKSQNFVKAHTVVANPPHTF
jgi:hypothetical protein